MDVCVCDMCKQIKKKKVRFVKKYLKGQGLDVTPRNIKSVMNAMDSEGIVFN